MPRRLDLLDLEILDALATYNPRNLADVARKLGIPSETLRKRIKRLSSNFYFRLNLNIYHTNLGLKKAIVFVDAKPGFEDFVMNGLKTNDFWIYVGRYYGKFEGCLGIYTIPKEHSQQFEKFVKELENSDTVRTISILWSTCFQTVQSRRKWFDPNSLKWIFPWDEWVCDVLEGDTELPLTLIDPEDFPVRGDEIDLFILKELEKNATKDLTEIGKMLGISQQVVGYHYNKHLIPKGLIESFNVTFHQFDLRISDMFFFIFGFESEEKLAKFANSLLDKPFARGLGKVLGKNKLIAILYLPRYEFRRFIEALSELARSGFLHSYDYVIQDIGKAFRETIPYQCFKDGRWIYDHDKHIEKLQNLVEKATTERSSAI